MRKVKVEAKAVNENLVDQFLIFQPEAPNPLDPTYAPSSNLPNPDPPNPDPPNPALTKLSFQAFLTVRT